MAYQRDRARQGREQARKSGMQDGQEGDAIPGGLEDQWQSYLRRLHKLGYFVRDGEAVVRGSKLWGELENRARASFLEAHREAALEEGDADPQYDAVSGEGFSVVVDSLLESSDFEGVAASLDSGDCYSVRREDDSDQWMDISEEEFDRMLSQYGEVVMEGEGDLDGGKSAEKEDSLRGQRERRANESGGASSGGKGFLEEEEEEGEGERDGAESVAHFLSSLKGFIGAESSHEGVELSADGRFVPFCCASPMCGEACFSH